MCKVDTSQFIVTENNFYEKLTALIDTLEGRWIVVSSKDRYAHYKLKGQKHCMSFSGSSYDYSRAIQKFRVCEDMILFLKAPQIQDLDQVLLGVHFHVECKVLFLDYFNKYHFFCDRIRDSLPTSSVLVCK